MTREGDLGGALSVRGGVEAAVGPDPLLGFDGGLYVLAAERAPALHGHGGSQCVVQFVE